MTSVNRLLEVVLCAPLLRRKDLAKRYGVILNTIDGWHRRGVLPAPVYLKGSDIPLWRPCDIAAAEKSQETLIHHGKKNCGSRTD